MDKDGGGFGQSAGPLSEAFPIDRHAVVDSRMSLGPRHHRDGIMWADWQLQSALLVIYEHLCQRYHYRYGDWLEGVHAGSGRFSERDQGLPSVGRRHWTARVRYALFPSSRVVGTTFSLPECSGAWISYINKLVLFSFGCLPFLLSHGILYVPGATSLSLLGEVSIFSPLFLMSC